MKIKGKVLAIMIVFLLFMSACSEVQPKATHTFLTHMDDLKAINLAANYLKEQGETVNFQETYIEYHDAEAATAHISLADGINIDYLGDYLEIRLYQTDHPEQNTTDHCIVIYITHDGKVLGQNTLPLENEKPIEDQ